MLEAIEIGPADGARAAVIWLHGLGADGNDFVPIVPYLGLPPGARVRFVFPHAPMRSVTVNGGAMMRAWYDIRALEIDRSQDEAGIRQSQHLVGELVAREIQRGVPAQRLLLAGFSQGGAMALHVGLRLTPSPAGVIALSSYLLQADALVAERAADNANLPLLLAHGLQDPIIPVALGRASRDHLRQLGYEPQWYEFPMAHEVCMEEIQLVGRWLGVVLGLGSSDA